MSDVDRKLRAEHRRERMMIRRARFDSSESDIFPVRGIEAISLATSLTRESWSISGRQWPGYKRNDTPYLFIDSISDDRSR